MRSESSGAANVMIAISEPHPYLSYSRIPVYAPEKSTVAMTCELPIAKNPAWPSVPKQLDPTANQKPAFESARGSRPIRRSHLIIGGPTVLERTGLRDRGGVGRDAVAAQPQLDPPLAALSALDTQSRHKKHVSASSTEAAVGFAILVAIACVTAEAPPVVFTALAGLACLATEDSSSGGEQPARRARRRLPMDPSDDGFAETICATAACLCLVFYYKA